MSQILRCCDMGKILKYIVFSFCLIGLVSCRKEEIDSQSTKNYTIAVIAPGDDASSFRYKRTVKWAIENIEKAQQGNPTTYSLRVEWYDEDTEDLTVLSQTLSQRKDIVSVVGPIQSDNMQIVAENLRKVKKNCIAPVASSADLVRTYAGQKFFWSLCETDISQCEVLLTLVKRNQVFDSEPLTIVVADSPYGKTFSDWLPFLAVEMGLTIDNTIIYNDDTESVREVAKQVFKTPMQNVIFVPSSYSALQVVQEELIASGNRNSIHVVYPDIVDDPRTLQFDDTLLENVQGVSIAADPSSGFELSYQSKFNNSSVCGESQLYDAVILSFLSALHNDLNQTKSVCESMSDIVSTTGASLLVWDYVGLRKEIDAIVSGDELYNICGASSELNFDTKVQTNITQSYYSQWRYFKGRFVPFNYFSTKGSLRSYPSLAAWNWDAKKLQEFSNTISITYPTKKDNWALLVAGSVGWFNYRHQADVLDMYKILKDNGFDDDHIILIIENDIVNNESNSEKGWIRVSPTGENLAVSDDVVDYHLTDLEPSDLVNILSGVKTDKLPKVISSTSNDNVFVFWSGHGKPGSLCWNTDFYTTDIFEKTLDTMQGKYRKMLWMIETCYSGCIGFRCQEKQYPGVLCMCAANESETSKADVKNNDLGVWMSNRFTSTITNCLRVSPEISLRDLYYEVSRQTIGSHVTMYNVQNFDNLFVAELEEFVKK